MPSIPYVVAVLIIIFLAIGLHEYAHAKFADNAGDPTPRMYGRVTLNLTKHFELVGTIMILITTFLGFGIGWGKPVPMDPSKMKNPRWDHFMAVLAGPMTNLLLATAFAVAFRLVYLGSNINVESFLYIFLSIGVLLNLSLFCFNLIPLGPLDGMWLFGTFLDEKTRFKWTKWNLTSGQFLFLGIILIGQAIPGLSLFQIIGPPMLVLYQLLTGVPFVPGS